MENKVDDLGFHVVPNPKAGRKTMFQIIYPIWYKIKRLPGMLIMKARMRRRRHAKLVFMDNRI